jgi:hypothetical protein
VQRGRAQTFHALISFLRWQAVYQRFCRCLPILARERSDVQSPPQSSRRSRQQWPRPRGGRHSTHPAWDGSSQCRAYVDLRTSGREANARGSMIRSAKFVWLRMGDLRLDYEVSSGTRPRGIAWRFSPTGTACRSKNPLPDSRGVRGPPAVKHPAVNSLVSSLSFRYID